MSNHKNKQKLKRFDRHIKLKKPINMFNFNKDFNFSPLFLVTDQMFFHKGIDIGSYFCLHHRNGLFFTYFLQVGL